MSRYELRFSGAGGQGLITAGIIMATAASIYEGKQAVQSQSYGPEARGGDSCTTSTGTRSSCSGSRLPTSSCCGIAFRSG